MQPKRYLLSNGGVDILDVTVRKADPADADGIYELSLPFIESGILIVRDRAFYAANAMDFSIVEADRRIAACAGVRLLGPTADTSGTAPCFKTAEIFNVAVGKEWQDRGLGRLIMLYVLGGLTAQQFNDVLLLTKTTAGWFGRFGFVQADPRLLPPDRLAAMDAERGSIVMRRCAPRSAHPAVRFSRSGTEREWNPASGSLLSFAEDTGVTVDSLCWAGICGACESVLRHGTVSYQVWPECDPRRGEVLLCIAEPITDLVIDR